MTLDTVLLLLVAGFAITGFMTGLIQTIGSIVGIVVGSLIASRSFKSVGGFALPLLGNNQVVAASTSFILIFAISSKLVGTLFYLLDKAYKLAAIIPGLKGLNRLGGLIVGAIEGALFFGVILTALTKLPLSEQTLSTIQHGTVSHLLLSTTRWALPLLPGLYEKAQSIMP